MKITPPAATRGGSFRFLGYTITRQEIRPSARALRRLGARVREAALHASTAGSVETMAYAQSRALLI